VIGIARHVAASHGSRRGSNEPQGWLGYADFGPAVGIVCH
jgi:hypothetical protein